MAEIPFIPYNSSYGNINDYERFLCLLDGLRDDGWEHEATLLANYFITGHSCARSYSDNIDYLIHWASSLEGHDWWSDVHHDLIESCSWYDGDYV